MNDIFAGYLAALWLGILTAISPCPLATNIAAISFLSKKIVHPLAVLTACLAYTAGRMLAYALIGFLIIKSLLSVPVLATFLQQYMNKILGPILIVAGVFLLDAIKISLPGMSISEKHQGRFAGAGVPGAFALGVVFALAFCPLSAGIFFGSLIPLAMAGGPAGMTMPLVYGAGTAIPALIFAVAIAVGAASVAHWFRKITALEPVVRKVTGIVFIVVGIYYVLTHIFQIKLG